MPPPLPPPPPLFFFFLPPFNEAHRALHLFGSDSIRLHAVDGVIDALAVAGSHKAQVSLQLVDSFQ